MSGKTEQAAAHVYRGLWAVLVTWFRVPEEPPTLPVAPGQTMERFRPAEGFLRYLKLWFWLVGILIDVGLTVGTIAAIIALWLVDLWWVALLIIPPALVLIVVPDIIAYIAIHLRYDTTWYVMTDRSLRLRRGVWLIHEMTVTFENVQNVKLRQGPVQRFFGIADVIVETAGGGSASGSSGASAGNCAIVEGIREPERVRDQILQRLRHSRSAGLGDEHEDHAPGWTRAHLEVLREIRQEVAALD